MNVGPYNPYLTSLQLGENFTQFAYMDGNTCQGLVAYPKLSNISVSRQNESFIAYDNVLYRYYQNPFDSTNEYLLLVVYPMGKEDTSYTFDWNVFLGFYKWEAYTKLQSINSLNVDVRIVGKNVNDYVTMFGDGTKKTYY